jgi:hypothetical protein
MKNMYAAINIYFEAENQVNKQWNNHQLSDATENRNMGIFL